MIVRKAPSPEISSIQSLSAPARLAAFREQRAPERAAPPPATSSCALVVLAVQRGLSRGGNRHEKGCWAALRVDLYTVPGTWYPGLVPGLARRYVPAGAYQLVTTLRVRPEHDRAQSRAIALRSPASERPSDHNRYSPDIHP
eukprot:scaffold110018_cov69-Phaeocystis_antarctica.AAC.6